MNDKKICFITCVNYEREYEEFLLYINNLNIPKGYEIDAISIKEAESMTAGYNAAIKNTDAKYKVYLHQDTYIINKNFIYDILHIFNLDETIGMIGVAGAKTIPTNGVWWESDNKYGQVYESHTGKMELLEFNEIKSDFEEVKVIDGLIMVTQYDLPWREDIFAGWHFYDISQSVEFSLAGYKIVIPKQEEPWCIHDCGLRIKSNIDKDYQNKFLQQYSKYTFPLVSVLIPTYNRPGYLKLALDSVINQTYKNIEIIIGDDSTNNETEKLLMENYINKYTNIRYYHNEKNLGQFDNYLKLFNMAKGDFINYLMDDDLFEFTKIDRMMNYFIKDSKEEISLITSHKKIIAHNGKYEGIIDNTEKIISKDSLIDGMELGTIMIKNQLNLVGKPTAVLFRKKYLREKFGIFNGIRFKRDLYQGTWLNLLNAGKAMYINAVLSYCRVYKDKNENDNRIILQEHIDHGYKLLTCREKKYINDEMDYFQLIKGYLFKLDEFFNTIKDVNDLENSKLYKEIEDIYKLLLKKEEKFLIDFESKPSVLITNNHLVNYGGSEIVTLNLAKSFILKGYNVIVATFSYNYPIKKIFEENNIKVCSLLENCIDNIKFTLIWSQHFTTLNDVLFNKNISADKIVVNSMSPFEPLESPPVFSEMISLNISNSEETKFMLISEGVKENNIYIMPNPVDDEFVGNFDHNRKPNLRSICIVSNHVPREIYDTCTNLKNLGINVDIFGLNDKPIYISAKLLKSYDAIITIGKTVQYGMIMGIPVYCYDRFGGPGWVKADNFNRAYSYNFSGRCSNRKITAEEITQEVICNYKEAFLDRKVLYDFALRNFIMGNHLNNILKILDSKEKVQIKEIKKRYGMIKRQNLIYRNILL